MTSALPLLQVESLDAPLANYRGRRIVAAEFVAQAEALAAALPARKHLVNLCENRYHFALVWAAACLREQLTLLPPSQAQGILDELKNNYPDQHTLDDDSITQFLSQPVAPVASLSMRWQLPGDRIVALTFTSGSTGMPQAHAKPWRTLARNSQLACAEILGGRGTNIVATVPAQHAYGLETSLISAFAAGCVLFDAKPFFPQDVRAALEAMNAPRTLVTTPPHLRALLEAHVELPPVARVVSATAPLGRELAEQIERAWSTEVREIYGCTEAGIMARRRTAQTEMWETFSGGTVVHTSEGPQYHAPQLAEAIPLQDLIESIDPTHFYLRGRAADMIKVAGKRTSLQEITRHLLSVAGVKDAAVFVPEQDARPVAFVVAPGATSQAILAALSDRMEPVFLPRPLLLVDTLPRNAVGKLPREALLAMWAQRHDS